MKLPIIPNCLSPELVSKMFKKYLKSQKGFGFADVLGAAVIVGISLTALFMIILSSKIRITNDYHYRKALLGALSKMELIKYYNKSFSGELYVSIDGLDDDVVLDESYRPVLKAKTRVNVNTTYGLIEITPYTARKELTITMEWIEKSSSIIKLFKEKKTTVVMREDYYYNLTTPEDGS